MAEKDPTKGHEESRKWSPSKRTSWSIVSVSMGNTPIAPLLKMFPSPSTVMLPQGALPVVYGMGCFSPGIEHRIQRFYVL